MYAIFYIFENYSDLLYKIKNCINNVIKEKNKENNSILKLINIFKHQMYILNINLNPDELINELLSLIFIQSFSENFVIFDTFEENEFETTYFYENNKLFYKTHDIINSFSNNLNQFIIFFDINDNSDLINNNQNIKSKKCNEELCFFLITFCESEKILLKKQIKQKKKKINFYGFNNINNFFILNTNLKINFFETSLKIYENNYYLVGLFYTNVTKVFKENIKSNKYFILNNHNIIEKIKKIEYFLDKNIYIKILNELKTKYNFIENGDNFFEFILRKYSQSNEFFFLKNLQKLGSQYYFILIYIYLGNFEILFKEPFYLNCCFDFRGRIYTDSSISPVGNKLFRYLYNYGEYNDIELKNFNNTNYNYDYVNYILEKTNLNKIYPNLNFKEKFIQKIIQTTFFELGKINKSKYLEEFNGVFCKKDFINFGIDLFISFNNNNIIDFDKKLEIMYILNIIENYNNSNFIKSIIYKDSTASAIQLLMILLDSKDNKNLQICNLIDDGN